MEKYTLGEYRSQMAQINITALICMAVLIIGVLAVKYISPTTYSKVKEWYSTYISDETVPLDSDLSL
ncbi:MAG: hypothetical protein II372_03405 [Clostridia bacterium]|nr:hypothetical protein [Clostridia bacterium]MEE0808030.1 hypothetical protein [Acutalibacteraceae bacterium]